MAELQVASDAFGQLAQIIGQRYGTESKAYRVLFALSKSFAIAQAAVSLGINVSKASEVGFPENIPFIVAAFAQGAEIASIIAGAAFGGGSSGGGSSGYSKGGYTGGGGVHEPAGIVHRGEVVWSQKDVARAGGVNIVEAMRTGTAYGYADGGVVGSAANGMPITPELDRIMNNARTQPGQFDRGIASGSPTVGVRIINQVDPKLTLDTMASQAGEAVLKNVISRNATLIKQIVRN